ncbi:MAG: LysM peptidoglycan-binding domain-containing protein [Eubacterium sp.]|nr:LysM peptidoglycan-binding domain-containing protein [Eubacterium sp.]
MTRAYDGVQISYTDSNKDNTLTYQYLIGPGKRILKLNESAESLQDAEIKAKAKLLEHNRACQTARIKLKGDTKFVASKCCNLKGFGKLDGKYYIDSVTHDKDPGGGYHCSLEMHLCIVIKGVNVAKLDSEYMVRKASASGTAATGKEYTVVSGDTLWKISTNKLGTGTKYMQIYHANSETIESAANANGRSSSGNGHWIYPGTVLNIP